MSKAGRTAVVVMALGLIGNGCGSSATPERGAGSERQTSGAATRDAATAAPRLSPQEKAVKFAQCIRAHGVPHFPDPDADGEFNFGVDVTPEVFSKAGEACKALKPPGALSSARSPKEQAASLRFAACMRTNGVKDFPDPRQGEPLINTYEIPSSNRPGGMTILNAASDRCKSLLQQAMAGR